ncbi:MAG: LamG domain-containing protein, partial [Armatimonadetes bacterium]|nr:LamG domain-containing protein [Armatimonadota bacterium]
LDIVKQVNQRVAVWGPNLLGCEPVGVFHSDFRVEGSHCPGAKHFVRSMSENLLVGLLVGPDKAVYAVVVDKRVGLEEEPSGNREVEVTFAPEVKTISLLAAPQVKGQKRAGPRFKLTLEAGEGLLLRLEGAGLAERARQAESEGGSRPRPAGKVGPDGLVLRLSFDEGKGNVAHDSSPAKNDAFLCGAKWADGKFGKALDLRGDADLAQIPGAFLPAKHAMTVSCWVNPKYPAEGYGPVILIGSGGVDRFEFGFGPDNLYPVISDQETHSGGNLYVDGMKALLPEGAWGHIAIAAGPNGATTYIGGVPRSTTTYRGRFDFQTPLIQLGCRQNENYTGLLDELRVYNRCMSAQEVRKLHGDTRR